MTANKVFTVRFIARTSKSNPLQSTVYCRIALNGKRKEFSIINKIPSNSWNTQKEKLYASYKDYIQTNNYLEQVKSKLFLIFRELNINNQTISTTIIRNHFFNNTEQHKKLSELLNYHLQTQAHLLSTGTLKHYSTTEKYLMLFLQNHKKVDDIHINSIDFKFLTEFEAFLRSYKPEFDSTIMSHNSAMKYLTKLKKLLNLAQKLDWIQKSPFDQYKIKYTKTERGYLLEQEVQTLINKKITLPRLDYVRDLFIFACYTGLSYIDIQQLTTNNIILGIDGEYWIKTSRQKTKTPTKIPLLPIALDLLNKYKDHPRSIQFNRLFPRLSNQKVNTYLKEIAGICGFNKTLTFHLARHTFATTITLANGVPIETVSKLLGHKKLSTTQIYAKVLENKISSDMLQLKDKLNTHNKETLNSNRKSQ